jgi:hypothetical protein
MSRRRWILLLLCAALAVAIVHQVGVARELDANCATLCQVGCAGEDGCKLYRQVGCNCSYMCRSGVRGGTTCGGK